MVLADLNAEEKLSNLVKGEINSISLVGIKWDPNMDFFEVKVSNLEISHFTKRDLGKKFGVFLPFGYSFAIHHAITDINAAVMTRKIWLR